VYLKKTVITGVSQEKKQLLVFSSGLYFSSFFGFGDGHDETWAGVVSLEPLLDRGIVSCLMLLETDSGDG
jgi:hypothetical protein